MLILGMGQPAVRSVSARAAVPPVPPAAPAPVVPAVAPVPAAVFPPVPAAVPAPASTAELAAPAFLARPALGNLPTPQLRRGDVQLEVVVVAGELPPLRALAAGAEEVLAAQLEGPAAHAAERLDDA